MVIPMPNGNEGVTWRPIHPPRHGTEPLPIGVRAEKQGVPLNGVGNWSGLR